MTTQNFLNFYLDTDGILNQPPEKKNTEFTNNCVTSLSDLGSAFNCILNSGQSNYLIQDLSTHENVYSDQCSQKQECPINFQQNSSILQYNQQNNHQDVQNIFHDHPLNHHYSYEVYNEINSTNQKLHTNIEYGPDTQFTDNCQQNFSNIHYHQQSHYQAIPTTFHQNYFNMQNDLYSQNQHSSSILQNQNKYNYSVQEIQNEDNGTDSIKKGPNNCQIDVVQTHSEELNVVGKF